MALFIWFAENIGTFANAWRYPSQAQVWQLVSIAKLGSWFLLMIISYVMVSVVNRPREIEPADAPRPRAPGAVSDASLIS
ncbi:hypothetical protein D3C85_1779020 [compost metagenome]